MSDFKISYPSSEESHRALLEDTVVLHRRPYGETSVLLDIWTKKHGRFRALAKGARKPRTSSVSLLRPFIPLHVSWVGQRHFPVVTFVEPSSTPIFLQGTALFCGLYMNELLLRLLPMYDPYPKALSFYLDTLQQLATFSYYEPFLRFFEVSLLEEIGYGISFDSTVEGKSVHYAKHYLYFPESGLVETSQNTNETVNGATLLGLKQRKLEHPDELREAKHLMRRVIAYHLGGKPISSRHFFRTSSVS